MGSILVLYHSRLAPVRPAIADHLFSFRKYADGRDLHQPGRPLGAELDPSLDIDLVILHTILLSDRWQPMTSATWCCGWARAASPRAAVAIRRTSSSTPTSWSKSSTTSTWITSSRAPGRGWATIYGPLVSKGVGFTRVIPATRGRDRQADRPARTRRAETRHRHRLSGVEAEARARASRDDEGLDRGRGSSRGSRGWAADRHLDGGEGHLARGCLVPSPAPEPLPTIGVESGAGILDATGRFANAPDTFVSDHPDASFEDVERACFAGLDGRLNLRTISPRHLEAAATRTPQILVEGTYNGSLEAGRHYIPLRTDFSNLPDIVNEVGRGDGHRELAEQAYADLVASATMGTRRSCGSSWRPSRSSRRVNRDDRVSSYAAVAWEHAADGPSWGWVRVRQRVRPMVREALRRTGLLATVMSARAGAARDGCGRNRSETYVRYRGDDEPLGEAHTGRTRISAS